MVDVCHGDDGDDLGGDARRGDDDECDGGECDGGECDGGIDHGDDVCRGYGGECCYNSGECGAGFVSVV